jgi:hypothetical protein
MMWEECILEKHPQRVYDQPMHPILPFLCTIFMAIMKVLGPVYVNSLYWSFLAPTHLSEAIFLQNPKEIHETHFMFCVFWFAENAFLYVNPDL